MVLPPKKSNLVAHFTNQSTIFLLLIIIIFSIYYQVRHHSFTNYDDPLFVTQNATVKQGISCKNIIWAFSFSPPVDLYYPLTWLSHMLDCHLFGVDARRHLLMNVFIHCFNAMSLFYFLYLVTRKIWSSALVAFLLAVHPINVESVAWVAERKGLLSTLFWFATMIAYFKYVKHKSRYRYFLILFFFLLALLAKPIAVTLPFALLLLDIWPFCRVQKLSYVENQNLQLPKMNFTQLILEKLPLFFLSFTFIILNFTAQSSAPKTEKTIREISQYIALPVDAHLMYLKKFIWPFDLVPFYPVPYINSMLVPFFIFMVLITISFLAFYYCKSYPFFFVGWFWYLGVFFPVNNPMWKKPFYMADRYAYLPYVGLYIIIAWTVSIIVTNRTELKTKMIGACVFIIFCFSVLSYQQTSLWKDSISLFQNAIKITPNSYLSLNNLGIALKEKGKISESIEMFKRAIPVHPNPEEPLINLGDAMLSLKNTKLAMKYYQAALLHNPSYPEAYHQIGALLVSMGEFEDGIAMYKKTLVLAPDSGITQNNLANAYYFTGNLDKAIFHYQKAIQINPNVADFYSNLGTAFAKKGETKRAIQQFKNALILNPRNIKARINLEKAKRQIKEST